jgi:hypothetical protein
VRAKLLVVFRVAVRWGATGAAESLAAISIVMEFVVLQNLVCF